MMTESSTTRRHVATLVLFSAAVYVVLVAAGVVKIASLGPCRSPSFSSDSDAELNAGRDPSNFPTDAALIASTDDIEVEELIWIRSENELRVAPARPVSYSLSTWQQFYIPDLAMFRDRADLTYG